MVNIAAIDQKPYLVDVAYGSRALAAQFSWSQILSSMESTQQGEIGI
jgi:hypothetical protein